MADTVKCPLCGTERELQPHPSDAKRQVAYCNCRGSNVSVVDRPIPTRKPTHSKEKK